LIEERLYRKQNLMMMPVVPQISVIVPVYNTERYLHQCIQSILSQSFTDFEVLVIDDGSIDGSGEICDEYANNDERVSVFHRENGGVTAARKSGVQKSIGNYIIFVDSDDTIRSDAMEILLNAIYDFDIVIANNSVEKVLSSTEYIHELLLGNISLSPWARIFKRTLFDESVFNFGADITHGEDYLMNLYLARNASKIKYITNTVYNYFNRTGSISSVFVKTLTYEKLFDQYIQDFLHLYPKEYFKEDYIHLRLRALKGMILSGGKIDYCDDFVRNTLHDCRKNKSILSIKERVMIFSRFLYKDVVVLKCALKCIFEYFTCKKKT
jgi:glycosyltransferase involved in cell wall biosynthesis